MLANYFYKQCYDRTFAQDLVQETFLRILRSAHRYRPEAKFKTFLFTVARNLWIDQHRSRKAAPRTISADIPLAEDGATLADPPSRGRVGTSRLCITTWRLFHLQKTGRPSGRSTSKVPGSW